MCPGRSMWFSRARRGRSNAMKITDLKTFVYMVQPGR